MCATNRGNVRHRHTNMFSSDPAAAARTMMGEARCGQRSVRTAPKCWFRHKTATSHTDFPVGEMVCIRGRRQAP